MAISFDKAFGIHQHTIGARAARSEVLASNIANADTPNYKARDLDFSEALARAKSQQGFQLQRTNSAHIPATRQVSSEIGYRVPDQPDTGDGNTVNLQTEKTLFMQNGMEYQASLSFLTSKVQSLKKSIKGE